MSYGFELFLPWLAPGFNPEKKKPSVETEGVNQNQLLMRKSLL
jgi:hypothetical protein